jgi:hypothetical protein
MILTVMAAVESIELALSSFGASTLRLSLYHSQDLQKQLIRQSQ